MDQSLFEKKVQCTVNRGRSYASGRSGSKHVHQGVGAKRFVVLPDQLKDLLTQSGQAHSATLTQLARGNHGVVDAVVMVVMAVGQGCFFHSGTSFQIGRASCRERM